MVVVSKAQKKFIYDIQLLIEADKWSEARNLLVSSVDFAELAFIKIFVGIETNDAELVLDGIAKAKKILGKPDKVADLHGAYYNLGNAYQFMTRDYFLKNNTYFGAEPTARKAIKSFSKSLSLVRDNRALVNLGNFYDEIGRPLEALLEYEKALAVDPNFGMAIGNKAQAIESLSSVSSYSTGYLILAYQLYCQALEHKESILRVGGGNALAQFQNRKNKIEDYFTKNSKTELLSKDLTHEKFSKKRLTKEEVSYTEFCLANNLYLNLHIFDLHSSESVGDNISTSFITRISDKNADTWVKEISMRLNEIKETFITGRYILWQSQQKGKSLSNISKQSLLINNLDYTAHNIYTGLLKSAYKEVFSSIDKIANTLNYYLNLGNPEEKINYRNIWYQDLEKDKGYATKILKQNYSLFGIFSITDELGTKPSSIRNLLEHTYMRIGTIGVGRYDTPTFAEFTRDTLDVYFKIKCSIIYLMNFISVCEEKKRSETLKKGKILPTIPLIADQWLDIW